MMDVITRSAADFYGLAWPPDVAYLVDGRPVTWAEVHHARRLDQARCLNRKRQVAPPRVQPCYVWTFLVPGWLFGGWWCYVVTRRQEQPVEWQTTGRFGRPYGPALAESIMRAVPLELFPLRENWDRWKARLAERHPRHHPRDPRPAGSIVGWLSDGSRFSLDKPGNGDATRRTRRFLSDG
jgi:hypothetical protein